MSTTLSTESFDLTKVTILPDLTPKQLAIAMINDDPEDFLRGMVVYKIEPIPSARLSAASSLKYELKYNFRIQVPSVWLADWKDCDAFVAGIPPGVECPIKTQLGRYTVTKVERPQSEDGVRDKIARVVSGVYVGSKHAVVDLRDSVAFRCGFRQVQEIEGRGG
ncbi:hypothetical protein CLAFUR0_13224 [Fulvia fulva]|nr:hypothetical protein CLAFUR0_13224 [Fulvia fulva]